MSTAFSESHVRRCRETWNTPDFAPLFVSFCQSCQFNDVHHRLQLEEIGGVQLALDVIRDGRDVALLGRAWIVMQNFVLVNRVDDPLEMKPIDFFVARGGVELAAIEMSKPEPRWGQTILTTLAWTSTNEKAVPRVIASGVHKVGIAYVRHSHAQFLDISMSFIRSASAAPSCRAALRADGALEAFLPFLDCNKSDEPFQMRRGFRAASVVARLAGNDETGVGPATLRNNPHLIATTLKIFSQVLDAGPDGTVINMLVNPHFITMDLLIISTSDVNKPLLVGAIPICMNALRLRGESNPPMVADIVKTFLQLSFEPNCRRELQKLAPELCDLLRRLVPPPEGVAGSRNSAVSNSYNHDMETFMASQLLRNTLLSPAAPGTPTSASSPSLSSVGGFVRRILPNYDLMGNRSASPTAAGVNSTGSASDSVIVITPNNSCKAAPLTISPQHVMLSYCWSSSDIVRKADELLKSNNTNVWVDYRCMGSNLNESMEQAISNAMLVVVFISKRYKESAICRKEVESAEERGVPLLFVLAEEGYKPDGWLAYSVSKAPTLVGGWNGLMLRTNFSKIMDKVNSLNPPLTTESRASTPSPQSLTGSPPKKQYTGVPSPAQKASASLYSATPSANRLTRSTSSSSEEEIGTARNQQMAHLITMVASLTSTVNEMKREISNLRQDVKELKMQRH